jgi:YVTN family beta-propeller protein
MVNYRNPVEYQEKINLYQDSLVQYHLYDCGEETFHELIRGNYQKQIGNITIEDDDSRIAFGYHVKWIEKCNQNGNQVGRTLLRSISFTRNSKTNLHALRRASSYLKQWLETVATMPINLAPLTRNEVQLLRNWIVAGCPNRDGDIPFSENAGTRPKAYITNQGCDGVSIVDAATHLVMRYVRVGGNPTQIENPHCLRVSPNKQDWFVCFSSGQYFEAYDAVTDTLRKRTFLGPGNWNILKVSPDSRYVSVTDFSNNGKWVDDGKTLLHDYITAEELRACTTCNACVEECPVSISPLDIILKQRRYLILDESNSPGDWNAMFGNIENNLAPWKFSPDEREAWTANI